MPRAHLSILAVGTLLVILAGLSGNEPAGPAPGVIADARSGAEDLGEPDLYMETAEISQFAADGALAWRIRAIAIVHYPEADHTLLDAPRMVLHGADEVPWELSAEHGRVIGGTGLLDAGLLPGIDGATPGSETVLLEDDVSVRRRRPAEGFVELRTEALTLFPGREYAETGRPVIIDSQTGRTTAQGLRADLAAGTLALGTPPRRVRTTILPGTL